MADPRYAQALRRQGDPPTTSFDRRWYALYPSRWLGRRPARVRLHGRWLALWRDGAGQAHAVGDRCPHLGASLAGGRVVDDRLECPYHGFKYDASGACVEVPRRGRKPIPKTLCTPRFLVRELDGWLFVYWAEPDADAPEIDYFPEMVERGARSRHWYSQRLWPIHISRAIENMLDVAHLGTVHRGWLSYALKDTIEPVFEVAGPRLTLRGDGQNKTYAAYCHPNLWMQWLGPRFLTTAVLVPEDDHATRIYLRSSQGFVDLPVLGTWLAGLKHALDAFALWQDSRVVFTQTPDTADGHRLDSLVEFDVHIGELRKMRARLGGERAPRDDDAAAE
jgi:phenylpropionate dioxygenase-like ring-hydroxylating dioxygenase large terminal subunit